MCSLNQATTVCTVRAIIKGLDYDHPQRTKSKSRNGHALVVFWNLDLKMYHAKLSPLAMAISPQLQLFFSIFAMAGTVGANFC
jgi:hypothetical protein